MNPTPDDKKRFKELLQKIQVSGSFDSARYSSELSTLAGNIDSGSPPSTLNVINAGAAEAAGTSSLAAIAQIKNDELKNSLTQLAEYESKLMPKLDKALASEVDDDFQRFVREAAKETPRKKWMELSAAGLHEAAKSIAPELVAPIAETLKKVLDIV